MKKSELIKVIKEELTNILKEERSSNPSDIGTSAKLAEDATMLNPKGRAKAMKQLQNILSMANRHLNMGPASWNSETQKLIDNLRDNLTKRIKALAALN